NDDAAAFAVDGGDHAIAADGAAERAREIDVGGAVREERRSRDDLLCAGGEDFFRARHGSDAAADAAPQRTGDLRYEREVVAGSHRSVQIDHLHLREALEPPHPLLHVHVPDPESLALHAWPDRAVLEIDGRNQHRDIWDLPRKHEGTKQPFLNDLRVIVPSWRI